MRALITKAAYIRGHRTANSIVPDLAPHEFDPSFMQDLDGELSEPKGESADPEPTLSDRIAAVLYALDHDDDSVWTDAGLVRMDVVEEALGDKGITREQVEAALPGFRRDQ